jgi:hypothetical protein
LFGLIQTRNTLSLNTAEEQIKTNNMRRYPRVALTIVNVENPYQQVMIRCQVVEMRHDGADEHIDSLAKKYSGMDKYPYRSTGEHRVIVKIVPDHVFTIGDKEPA